MTIYQKQIPTPLGKILLEANDNALTGVYFNRTVETKKGAANENKIIIQAEKELGEYFAGERREFNVPVAAEGTVFQSQTWRSLQKIPFGKTISYKELAKAVGNGNASRAVGSANGKNPISIIIPCHRVINANNKLGGYAGGLKNKAWLLEHEKNFS